MPTTLTGLLLFVVLLPGITYVAVRDRKIPPPNRSVFRETVTVVTAGIVATSVSVGLFIGWTLIWPGAALDIDLWAQQGGEYVRANFTRVIAWASGCAVTAVGLAAAAGWLAAKQTPHSSQSSAWLLLLKTWHPGDDRVVRCVLDDGSQVAGKPSAFNRSVEDIADRDLTLERPIGYRPPGAHADIPYPYDAVCVSARRIVAMFVAYDPAGSTRQTAAEQEPTAAREEETAR